MNTAKSQIQAIQAKTMRGMASLISDKRTSVFLALALAVTVFTITSTADPATASAGWWSDFILYWMGSPGDAQTVR